MSKPHTTSVLKSQNKATVYDVAELAGVSIKTVSRVVNRGQTRIRDSQVRLDLQNPCSAA